MPREIDCPDCGGTGDYASSSMGSCGKCDATGKITVYTQAELDEEIGEYANTKLYQEGYQSGVKAENEACALECEKIRDRYIYSDPYDSESEQEAIEMCADKIRARNK